MAAEPSSASSSLATTLHDLVARLAEDSASLTRVRNRFARTPDSQLPKVMNALLPKLLTRLEEYRREWTRATAATTEATTNATNTAAAAATSTTTTTIETIRKHKAHAEQHIHGVLATAMERLKGYRQLSSTQLVPALLPFCNSSHAVVSTWSLAFLQVALPRTAAAAAAAAGTNDTKGMPSNDNQLDWSIILSTLMESLAQIHFGLLQIDDHEGNNEAATQTLEQRWIRISWLLLDSFMILSGHRPMIDWDVDTFEAKAASGGGPNRMDDASIRTGLVESAENVFRQSDGGCSMLSLLMDLMLFWPDDVNPAVLSPAGVTRMTFRSKIPMVEGENEDDDRRHFGRNQFHQFANHNNMRPDLPMQFQRQVRPRRATNRWSETANVYLRYLKRNGMMMALWPVNQALFQSTHQKVKSVVFDDRALFLAILTANFESMHGRVAMDYLNQWRASAVSPSAAAVARQAAQGPPVSLPLVCATLIHIVGAKETQDLRSEFRKTNENPCWERIIGPGCQNGSMQRPPLPRAVASRVMEVLVKSPIQWSGDQSVDDAYSSLLIEMAVRVDGKYLSMYFVSWIYHQLQLDSNPSALPSILDAIVGVLQAMVDITEVADSDTERRATLRQDQLPLGVPAPVGRRGDASRLLAAHRQNLKLKNLMRDEATQARKEAYKLIPCFTTSVCMQQWENLPNLLLQCSVYEDRSLEQFVVKALDAMLERCLEMLDNSPGNHHAAALLPALVEAALAEVVAARFEAMKWVKGLLVKLDVEVALYLSFHLKDDDDTNVARMAQGVVSTYSAQVNVQMKAPLPVKFLDLGVESDGTVVLQKELEDRIVSLESELALSNRDESTALLVHHNFSLCDAIEAYTNERNTVRRICGFKPKGNGHMEETSDDGLCGICYDDCCERENFGLSCGHCFCQTCWLSYIDDASHSPRSFLDLRCPQHECTIRVQRNDIAQVAPQILSKWDAALLQTFIQKDRSMRQCPGPDCSCVAMVSTKSYKFGATGHCEKVTCDGCTSIFCFDCGGTPHAPATCRDMKEWSKLMGLSDFAKKLHSKPCPGCDAFIEKNGGCNHMNCTKCGTDFCWLCLDKVDGHLAHVCNTYDPSDSAEDDFERHALFTATRYEAHDDAEAFALNQVKTFSAEKLLEAFWFLEDEDPATLSHALSTVVEARNFLKHSYIATLGLRNKPEPLEMHERHHACLEMFTERLSQLTETKALVDILSLPPNTCEMVSNSVAIAVPMDCHTRVDSRRIESSWQANYLHYCRNPDTMAACGLSTYRASSQRPRLSTTDLRPHTIQLDHPNQNGLKRPADLPVSFPHVVSLSRP